MIKALNDDTLSREPRIHAGLDTRDATIWWCRSRLDTKLGNGLPNPVNIARKLGQGVEHLDHMDHRLDATRAHCV